VMVLASWLTPAPGAETQAFVDRLRSPGRGS